MSDVEEWVGILRAAVDPLRFRLLLLSEQRPIHPADARALAASTPAKRSGASNYHLALLETSGLMNRTGRGVYEISPRGAELLRALGVPSSARDENAAERARITIDLDSDVDLLEALRPHVGRARLASPASASPPLTVSVELTLDLKP